MFCYDLKMVVEAEIVVQQNVPVFDVQYQCSNLQDVAAASLLLPPISAAESVSTDLSCSQVVELRTLDGLGKERTQCAPNGYYFMLVYDKGPQTHAMEQFSIGASSFLENNKFLVIVGLTSYLSSGRAILHKFANEDVSLGSRFIVLRLSILMSATCVVGLHQVLNFEGRKMVAQLWLCLHHFQRKQGVLYLSWS